jgi:hypothetical protein
MTYAHPKGVRFGAIGVGLACAVGCAEEAAPAAGPSDTAGSGGGVASGEVSASAAIPDAVACEGVERRTGPPPSEGSGTLRLQLVATAGSGARYRLKNAVFSLFNVSSPDLPDTPNMVSNESAPLADELELELPAGEYLLSLLEGWSLERVESSSAALVSAALLSPRSKSFVIQADAETHVRHRFEVSTPDAELASAEAAPRLAVLERPGPLSGRVCVESSIAPEPYSLFAQADVEALRGCSELRGELFVGPTSAVDLTPLSQLRRVCGSLTISNSFGSFEAPAVQPLTGLDALEEVDALVLIHPGVTSLEPLRSLHTIQRPDPATDVLGLFVLQADLDDLEGLENVTQIRSVRLDGTERLVSSRGLRLPAEIQRAEFRGANLADLVALEAVTTVSGWLSISSAVRDLSALTHLRHAGSLSLYGNARLENADALAGLESVGELSLGDNPRLATLPVFSALTSVTDLFIIESSFTGALAMPALVSASQLFVTGNTALSSISLPALTSVGSLAISRNLALATLDMPALNSASSVSVFANPQLSDTGLAYLEALGATSVKIGNNKDGEAPLDPCPWLIDHVCDEPGGSGLCAPGSDVSDCQQIID